MDKYSPWGQGHWEQSPRGVAHKIIEEYSLL